MPELPEVETVARQLDPDVSGQKLTRVQVRDHKLEGADWGHAAGYTITKVRRVGKRVVFDLQKGKSRLWIAVHLRMTGRLIWVAAPGGLKSGAADGLPAYVPKGKLPNSSSSAGEVEQPISGLAVRSSEKLPRLIFHFSRGEVRFYDTRRFGTVELLDAEPQLTGPAIDPLAHNFSAKRLGELLDGVPTPVKPWLLRQDRIAGMGNIYASEALFLAGIDPQRMGGALAADEVKRLRDAIADVMRRAVAKMGTTFSDYQDSRGKPGGFREFLQVYQRAGQPCRRCGTEIRQITQAQRSTFFCPQCQV